LSASIVYTKVRIMKTKLTCYFSIILFVSILASACSSSKNNQQTDLVQNISWQKDSLIINGDDGDWTKPLPLLDEKLGLAYAVSNDRDNLYILATSNNETTIQRILRGGLTVFINGHGVKEEAGAAGIVFPTGNRVNKDGKMLNDRPELQQNKQVALNAVADYSLFGFRQIKAQENFDYGKTNAEGIDVGIGLNPSGELVYEAMIPLNSFLVRNELGTTSRRNVAVGFVIETVPGQSGARGGGGGLSIGGGIGMGSFGSGGGIGVSIGSGALANIGGGRKQGKPTKIWRELQLARPPVSTK
jgi:hypothetical protein